MHLFLALSESEAESEPESEPATPPADHAAKPVPAPSKPEDGPISASAAPNPAAERQRFLDEFGPRGGVWFAQGMKFTEAAALYRQLVPGQR